MLVTKQLFVPGKKCQNFPYVGEPTLVLQEIRRQD
jgi:hypothetical protein